MSFPPGQIINNPVGDDMSGDGTDPSPPNGFYSVDIGYSASHLAFPYLLTETSIAYVGDEGLLQVPVGAPQPAEPTQVPCKIVRAHAAVMRKIVTYNYVRLNAMPMIPPPETTDANLVLLTHQRTPVFFKELSQGQIAYRVMGQYVYAVIEPLTSNDQMPTGHNPPYQAGIGEEQISVSDYDDTLIATG